jgi:2-keto-4-pentenoate hydratase/2-oxohepta-3-ene-1,7-dioic acid hydratase in catechol pathway
MKILCVGRNYADHAAELNNERPEEPVIFSKPDSAVLVGKNPFFIPDFSNEIHFEAEVVIKISRLGKNIQPRFAHKYFEHYTVGLDFTARDIQNKLKNKGLPWEKAKAFDGSAVIGEWREASEVDMNNLSFGLKKNGQWVQRGNTADMLFSIPEIIADVSRYFTLKIGDLIFTGTPAGVDKIEIGDVLEAYSGDEKLLTTKVK